MFFDLTPPSVHEFSELVVCSIMISRFDLFCVLDAEASRLLVNLQEEQKNFGHGYLYIGVLSVLRKMGETSSSSHSRQDPCVLGYGFHGAIATSTPPANFL